jgi:hypothetical protein
MVDGEKRSEGVELKPRSAVFNVENVLNMLSGNQQADEQLRRATSPGHLQTREKEDRNGTKSLDAGALDVTESASSRAHRPADDGHGAVNVFRMTAPINRQNSSSSPSSSINYEHGRAEAEMTAKRRRNKPPAAPLVMDKVAWPGKVRQPGAGQGQDSALRRYASSDHAMMRRTRRSCSWANIRGCDFQQSKNEEITAETKDIPAIFRNPGIWKGKCLFECVLYMEDVIHQCWQ